MKKKIDELRRLCIVLSAQGSQLDFKLIVVHNEVFVVAKIKENLWRPCFFANGNFVGGFNKWPLMLEYALKNRAYDDRVNSLRNGIRIIKSLTKQEVDACMKWRR